MEGLFGGGFNAKKLKPQLKMACGRIQIASNKKAALLKQSTREVAVLLADNPPKEEKARIRAEALIRDDNLIEAYEILQLTCELLFERIKLIQFSRDCPHDLVSSISTLIWASNRVEIEELTLIRKQFRAKYGKEFEENALRNHDGCLNERVVSKLSVEPPAAYLVQTYLERICAQFDVDWKPSMELTADERVLPMPAPDGSSVPIAGGTGLGHGAVTGVPPYPPGPPPPPFVPPPLGGGGGGTSDDPFAEPDIFVRPATTSSPAHSTTLSKKDSMDDEDLKPTGGSSSRSGGGGTGTIMGGGTSNDDGTGGDDSYANLAARFDSLKK